MDFVINQDYHIHTLRSFCSRDPLQTTENILKAAEIDGFWDICITDHFWDEKVPGIEGLSLEQNYKNISKNLPLPESDKVKIHFGCETDLDLRGVLGVDKSSFDKFDFVLVSTTHLHLDGFTVSPLVNTKEERAKLYVERMEKVLSMDLPFQKICFSHLTVCHILRGKNEDFTHLDVIDLIDDKTFKRLFSETAKKGAAVELNFDIRGLSKKDAERTIRPYRIAKSSGCKFCFGSDAHHPSVFKDRRERFTAIKDALSLEESDKYKIAGG